MGQLTKILQHTRIILGLSRPKLSAGIALSALTGYIIGRPLPGTDLIFLIAGIFLVSAGSSALNQYTERKFDSIMVRTGKRPIPAGEISPRRALAVSIYLMLGGNIILLSTGLLPVMLSLLNIVLYNYLYTSLKRKTSLALLPGALVGAVPPLIGFSAAGTGVSYEAILCFSLFMFLWQLPHFWLIAIRYEEDYRLAGYKFTLYPASIRNKRILVFMWILITSACLIVLPAAGLFFHKQLKPLLLILNAAFIFFFYRSLFTEADNKLSARSFALVNSFGVIVMLLFIINSLISDI